MTTPAPSPIQIHPLVKDGRRRSLLTPFLAVEAVKHWNALTSKASPLKKSTDGSNKWIKHKSTNNEFLAEVGTVLASQTTTDVDCITALASLLKGIMSTSKTRRISGKNVFEHRLVPIISSIASTYAVKHFRT